MRILFILTDQYPQQGPCSNILRNICLCSSLVDKFDIHVLTVKKSYSDYDKEIIDGITVHRFYEPEYIAMKDFHRRRKKNLLFDIFFYIRKIQKKLLTFQNNKTGIFKEKNSLKTVIKSMEKMGIELNSFSTIIPISGTLDAINIALGLKERYGYAGKLLVLQVDPCVSNAEYALDTLDLRKNFQNKMLDVVDAVLTLPPLYNEYCQTLSEKKIRDKIKKIELPNVISNISDILDIPKQLIQTNSVTNTIVCVFAGTFHKNVRDPNYMLNLFSNLPSNLKIFIIGRCGKDIIKKFNFEKNVVFLGSKSLLETKAILNSADFLVNLGNSVPNQVPSKIFDYISFGKPIIHIRKLENDPSMEYLSKYPLCLDLFEGDSIETNVAKLEDFISKNKGKRVDKDYIATTYKECTPEYCAEQLYQAILEVTQGSKNAIEHAEY